jgi:TolB-like protein/Tfp pilus assembly protein PilF
MLNKVHIERRLAAVVVAGFTCDGRPIGQRDQDDIETGSKWRKLRENLVEPKIAEHSGRLVRSVDDGLLIEFRSAVDAVMWASDVQRAILTGGEEFPEATVRMRIGINVEDVLVDGNDLHGDGVNIATHIQQLADPGEIVATAAVSEYVRNKVGVTFTDLGTRELKNINRPVRLFRLEFARNGQARDEGQPFLSWTDKPSIAMLPFHNLSGSPEEGYFGEGITEEIIAQLARNRSLLVISRQSTLRYADRRASPQQIAADLGVRYILDGTVQRQANRLRISAELIDASHSRTIWADRFDGSNDDIFKFQDDIALGIVKIIEPRLIEAEANRARSKPTENLDAYDCLLRALSLLYSFEESEFRDAGRYLDHAIELDPGYAQAYAYKAFWYGLALGEGRSKDAGDTKAAEIAAYRALALDPADSLVHAVAALVRSFRLKEPEVGIEMFDRALQLNPNSAFAWGLSASTCCFLGRPEEALERLRNAFRLSPFDPMSFFFLTVAGLAEFISGRYEEAVIWLRKAQRENPRFTPMRRQLAATLALLGRDDEAKAAAASLLEMDPQFRVSVFASWYPLRRPDDLERLATGLRLAGLPP